MSENGKALENLLQMFYWYVVDAKYRNLVDYGTPLPKSAPKPRSHRQLSDMGDSVAYGLPNVLVVKSDRESGSIDEIMGQFANSKAEHAATSHGKSSWQLMNELMRQKNIDKETFLAHTLLDEGIYYKIRGHGPGNPSMRTIVAFACGLGLDVGTAEKIMRAAGLAFDESEEHLALRFCVARSHSYTIGVMNEFLERKEYEPLGSKQRI